MTTEKPIIAVGMMVQYDRFSLRCDPTSVGKEVGSVPRGRRPGQHEVIAIGGAFNKEKPSPGPEMLNYPTLLLMDQ